MKSIRGWFVGLALGLSLVCSSITSKAQVPRGFTYQGFLVENGNPVNGPVSMTFQISDQLNNLLATQTIPNVVVTNGIFNVVLGGPGSSGFPQSMKFDQQYSVQVTVRDPITSAQVSMPSTLLWSSPYAFNADRVGGLTVSPTPVNGDLFPIPLNSTGRIDTSILPPILNSQLANQYVETINGVLPSSNGNFEILGGPGITITPGTNGITVSGPAGAGITGVTGTNGITGGGTSGNLVLGIGNGVITSQMMSPNIGIQSLAAENSSSSTPAVIALDSEANGNAALMIYGGVGSRNPTGALDGTGLSSGSPQTYWADEVTVPAATTTSLQVYNTLVNASSTIILTPVGISAFAGGLTITAQGAGTFTIGSKNTMGTSGGGVITAINYLVINH